MFSACVGCSHSGRPVAGPVRSTGVGSPPASSRSSMAAASSPASPTAAPSPDSSTSVSSDAAPPLGTPSSSGPATSEWAGPAVYGRVDLSGASVAVPSGWFARQVASSADPTWCFAPRSPSSAETADCVLWFRALVNQPSETIRVGFAPLCASQPPDINVVEAGLRTFGGRSASYSRSRDTCGSNVTAVNDITAYVVATDPAYALYADNPDETVRTVLADLVADSKLPRQRAPLPYYVEGSIVSRSHRADGYHVQLQPFVRSNSVTDGVVLRPTGHLTGFVIPDSVVTDNGVTLIGAVELSTDGWHVTHVLIEGG